jgi:7-cyano-7-deazaguanine synthase in queuosine biosynthesis|tara:strand:- start:900 stop:1583 length:684 start_codon:yes stop_codon:yes gene_type:complete
MKIVKSISCAETNLDIYDGPVGIMVSGGVDSSILLYYLMKHTTDTIHIYTTGSNLKYRRNAIIAPRVVEKCIELTSNNNIVHHIYYDEAATDSSMCDAPQKDLDREQINRVYDGTTMNPPHEVASKFVPEFDFDYTRKDTSDNEMTYNDDKFYMPWANTNKQGIVEMYRSEGVIDSLLPITRSCEYDPTSDYFYANTWPRWSEEIKDPQLGHCGECWWCKEREWGFK